jgi:DNA-binding XRE family transcriptional regulator
MDYLQIIQDALKSGEVSQTSLAKVSGVTQPTIWAIEHGKSQPRWETVCRLWNSLGGLCPHLTNGVSLIVPSAPVHSGDDADSERILREVPTNATH